MDVPSLRFRFVVAIVMTVGTSVFSANASAQDQPDVTPANPKAVPAVQPKAPGVQPKAPALQPKTPAVQPKAPVVQPKTPAPTVTPTLQPKTPATTPKTAPADPLKVLLDKTVAENDRVSGAWYSKPDPNAPDILVTVVVDAQDPVVDGEELRSIFKNQLDPKAVITPLKKPVKGIIAAFNQAITNGMLDGSKVDRVVYTQVGNELFCVLHGTAANLQHKTALAGLAASAMQVAYANELTPAPKAKIDGFNVPRPNVADIAAQLTTVIENDETLEGCVISGGAYEKAGDLEFLALKGQVGFNFQKTAINDACAKALQAVLGQDAPKPRVDQLTVKPPTADVILAELKTTMTGNKTYVGCVLSAGKYTVGTTGDFLELTGSVGFGFQKTLVNDAAYAALKKKYGDDAPKPKSDGLKVERPKPTSVLDGLKTEIAKRSELEGCAVTTGVYVAGTDDQDVLKLEGTVGFPFQRVAVIQEATKLLAVEFAEIIKPGGKIPTPNADGLKVQFPKADSVLADLKTAMANKPAFDGCAITDGKFEINDDGETVLVLTGKVGFRFQRAAIAAECEKLIEARYGLAVKPAVRPADSGFRPARKPANVPPAVKSPAVKPPAIKSPAPKTPAPAPKTAVPTTPAATTPDSDSGDGACQEAVEDAPAGGLLNQVVGGNAGSPATLPKADVDGLAVEYPKADDIVLGISLAIKGKPAFEGCIVTGAKFVAGAGDKDFLELAGKVGFNFQKSALNKIGSDLLKKKFGSAVPAGVGVPAAKVDKLAVEYPPADGIVREVAMRMKGPLFQGCSVKSGKFEMAGDLEFLVLEGQVGFSFQKRPINDLCAKVLEEKYGSAAYDVSVLPVPKVDSLAVILPPADEALLAIQLAAGRDRQLDGIQISNAKFVEDSTKIPFLQLEGRVATEENRVATNKLAADVMTKMFGDADGGQWPKPKVDTLEVIEPSEAVAEVFFNNGLAHYIRKEYPQAEDAFARAVVEFPYVEAFKYWHIVSLTIQKKDAEALRRLRPLTLRRRDAEEDTAYTADYVEVMKRLERIQGSVRNKLLEMEEQIFAEATDEDIDEAADAAAPAN